MPDVPILHRFARRVAGVLQGLWKDEGSIAEKTFRGGFWMLAGTGSSRVFQFLQTLILVRLLLPSDFGLMRLAMVVVSASVALSSMGIPAAVIQRKESSPAMLNTAWTLEALRHLLLAGIVFVVAQPVAAFYKEPLLAPMMRVMSLKFVFVGFRNMGLFLLERDMHFRRRQIYEVVLSLVGTASVIALALWLRSVWALVIGQVIYGAGELIGSYLLHPYRPRPQLDFAEVRKLVQYGKYLLASGIFHFARNSLDSILLGKWLGMTGLGYYSLARSLVELPLGLVTSVFGGVMFPAFSRLQHDLDAVRRAFLRAMELGGLVVFPVLFGIAVTAAPLVNALYTDRYLGIVPVVVLFCLVKLLLFTGSIGRDIFAAQGRPVCNTQIDVVSLSVWAVALWFLAPRWNMMGAAAAMGISALAQLVLMAFFLRRHTQISNMEMAMVTLRPLVPSVLMGLGVWGLAALVPGQSMPTLLLLVAAGVGLYAVFVLLLNRESVAYVGRVFESIAQK